MSTLKTAILAALLLGLAGLLGCKDKDADEQQPSASKTATGQQAATQQPAATREADEGEEGEEGPATPAAASAEQPAPQQTAGKQFVYSFDGDTPGQLPAKFHSAKTGGGAAEKWVVSADSAAPSKPNVVTQTSTDQTDYRFPLLISDEGSFQDLDLSVKFKAVSGNIQGGWFFFFRIKQLKHFSRPPPKPKKYPLFSLSVAGSPPPPAGLNLT